MTDEEKIEALECEVRERRKDAHTHAEEVRSLVALAAKYGAPKDEIYEARKLS